MLWTRWLITKQARDSPSDEYYCHFGIKTPASWAGLASIDGPALFTFILVGHNCTPTRWRQQSQISQAYYSSYAMHLFPPALRREVKNYDWLGMVWCLYQVYIQISYQDLMWCRPTDDQNNMIPPDQFENYRTERHLKYPCCLCADGTQKTYVESIVYPWWNATTGTLVWTTRCATDSCTYEGSFFLLGIILFYWPLMIIQLKLTDIFSYCHKVLMFIAAEVSC